MHNYGKTREDRKRERSERSSRAATLGWERIHAAKAAAGIVEIYDDVHAYGDYEITIKSIRSGKVNVLYLHEESEAYNKKKRRDNFCAELNGRPWKPEVVSISTVMKIIRKNIAKTKSGRVI